MRKLMDIFCRSVDLIAGILIGIATLVVVVSVVARYLFASPIPGAYDIARLLIGACIMWGFAAIGFKGGHITVDLLFEWLSARGRRLLNLFSGMILLSFVILLTWKMLARVLSARASGEATFDIGLPLWPFLALIWAAVVASTITVSIRLWLLATSKGDDPFAESSNSQ